MSMRRVIGVGIVSPKYKRPRLSGTRGLRVRLGGGGRSPRYELGDPAAPETAVGGAPTGPPPPSNRVSNYPLDHLLSGRVHSTQVPTRPVSSPAPGSSRPPRR